MKQSIVRLIPSKLRSPVGRIYQRLDYEIGKRIGRRDPLLPPKWLHSIRSTDFKEVGDEFFKYFVNIGGV